MSDDQKFCPQCGSENKRSAIFCSSCGSRFPDQVKGSQAEPTEENQQSSFNQQTGQPAQGGNTGQAGQYGEPAGKWEDKSAFEIAQEQRQAEGEPFEKQDLPEPDNPLTASIEFVKNPKSTAPYLMFDPDSPSGIYLVLFYSLLVGLLTYLIFTNPVFFNAFYRDTIKQSAANNPDITYEQARQASFSTYPILYAIVSIVWWGVIALVFGFIIKNGSSPNSPMQVDGLRAFRQINSYRFLPYIGGTFLKIILVLVGNITLYSTVFQWINIATGIFSAYLLWQSFDPSSGYDGSAHKILAVLIVIGKFFIAPIYIF